MKNPLSKTLAISLLAIASAAGGYAVTTEINSSNVKVQFEDYNKFTDIETRDLTTDKDKKALLEDIAEKFQKQTDSVLPEGYTLQVTVTDVDLAGENMPKPPQGERYRLYRDTTPPRLAFDYTIRDASDQEVAAGSATLIDREYKNNIKATVMGRGERAQYMDLLISDWASGELRKKLRNAS